jgi:DNA invertase Pin-like site-specific DNA recombinase
MEKKTHQRIGYARVSTDDQDMALQLDALDKAACDRIYSEKVSSRKASRPQLSECIKMLRRGDTLVVWRLDRLGRSMIELMEIVNNLADWGVGFVSLSEHIDTTTAAGTFTFHLFGALAEFERNTIRERTVAGLQAARARGRVGGRKPKLSDKVKDELRTLYDSKKYSVAELCRRVNISRSTFYTSVLEKQYGAESV